MIQLYGSWTDYFSISTVSRAISTELENRKIPYTVRNVHSLTDVYLDVPKRRIANFTRAPVALYIGYPPSAPGWLKYHDVQYIYTMCESDRIPKEWAALLNEMHCVFVPSVFCESVMRECNVRAPVKVIQHGVTPHPIVDGPKSNGVTNLLHVSGSLSFPERKGTAALVKAVSLINLERPGSLTLTLITHDSAHLRAFLEQMHMPPGTFFVKDFPKGLNAPQMSRVISAFDAVVQPSRGEGFGIVPLEARAIGVPCILTEATGHKEHFMPGIDVPVLTGSWTTMSTQGNEAGYAPSVPVENVVAALKVYLSRPADHRKNTMAWANTYASYWSWKNRLAPLIEDLQKAAKPFSHRKVRRVDTIGG